MFEIGLGVILAVLFVAAYLVITSFFRAERPEIGGLGHAVSLNPVDSSRALDGPGSRQALTSGETGQRNSKGGRDDVADDTDSKL